MENCVSACIFACTSWDHVREAKQKPRKGQAGVGSQFSLGHRWRVGQNVRLRLGVMWRRGLRNVCAYMCVYVRGGGELFVNAWRMCVPFKCWKVTA